MAEINSANVEVWRKRFARKYAGNVAGLKTLADQLADEAGETVTLTSFNEDGQSGGGAVTGNKMEMLSAAEDLISEMDAQAAATRLPVRCVYPVITAIPH